MVAIRPGRPEDRNAAIAVWRDAQLARRAGHPFPPEHEQRVRAYLEKANAFFVVAEENGAVLGMALGMQGLADDGAGPPVPGLCHVAMVFVAPERWGEAIGGRMVDELLLAARSRGYRRAQLWTHADNPRAQRLYERRAFRPSGRRKDDELGEAIVHYERPL